MERITTGGLDMPKLGLGTWRLRGAECQRAVEGALAIGFRHIDTAQMYGNEDAVGAALAASDVPRGDLHLTTKVWHENLAPAAMRRALETSLSLLKTDDVDLFLIHWPSPGMDLPAAMGAMVALRTEGLAKAIGVSNFPVALLRRCVEELQAPIACNQIEYHALLDQSAVLDFARAHGIAVTAYSPLAQGRLAEQPELDRIARKHGCSAAQVALRWLLDQDGVAAIPKAARPESQRANLDALSVRLDDEDRAAIAALPKDVRTVNPGFGPAWDPPRVAA
jgi:2,5-diketo-D-gluconate reductase B